MNEKKTRSNKNKGKRIYSFNGLNAHKKDLSFFFLLASYILFFTGKKIIKSKHCFMYDNRRCLRPTFFLCVAFVRIHTRSISKRI